MSQLAASSAPFPPLWTSQTAYMAYPSVHPSNIQHSNLASHVNQQLGSVSLVFPFFLQRELNRRYTFSPGLTLM
eukprot:749204-Hanusia_phi.AAC.4